MTDVGGVDVIKEFEVNSLNDVYLQGVTLSKKIVHFYTILTHFSQFPVR